MLDFIVAGMPRGGTTLVAELFNLHPHGFCFSQETHILPLINNLARNRPVENYKLPEIRAYIKRELINVLINLWEFNLHTFNSNRVKFNEQLVEIILEKVMHHLYFCKYGKELLIRCSADLRQLFIDSREKFAPEYMSAVFVGEKSPSNVFALLEHGALSTRGAVLVIREPFSTIASMRRRSANPADLWADVFRQPVVELAGMYINYARSLHSLSSFSSNYLIRYEDLVAQPKEVISSCYDFIGMDSSIDIVSPVSEIIKSANNFNISNEFSKKEINYILDITKSVREKSGYDNEFYLKSTQFKVGKTSKASHNIGVNALFGVHESEDNGSRFWLAAVSAFYVCINQDSRFVKFKFFTSFPAKIIGEDEVGQIIVKVGDHIAINKAFKREEYFEIKIDVMEIPGLIFINKKATFILDFNCSHFWVPISSDLNINDVRELSLMCNGIEIT